MKKIAYLLSIGLTLSLIGCGSTATATPKPTTPAVDQAAKQAEDGKKAIDDLKASAVKADFVEINGHYDQVKAKAVFVEGKVSAVSNSGVPNFLLNQGGGSLFYILDGSGTQDLKDGDMVKIYGRVTNPKEGGGIPSIWCSVVEKIASKDLAPAPNGPSMNKAEFDQLKTGMSYEQATIIIGGPGEVTAESGAKGDAMHTVMYSYKGDGDLGANANVMFQGDKLNTKAQMGLK